MGTRRSSAVATITALVIAACGSAGTIAPTSPAPGTSVPAATTPPPSPSPSGLPFAGQTLRVVHGQPGSFDDVQIGYWLQQLKDKYGLTVQFTTTTTTDVSLRAVISDSADLAVATSPAGLISLVQQSGSDVRMIATDADASDDVLVSQASIASVADLKGKVFGYSAPGAESDLIPHLCLNAAGFDYSSLKLVRIGGTSARLAALLSGQIDASVAHSADAALAVQKSNGKLKQLLDCGKSLGNYPQTGMVATGTWLIAHPALAQAVVDAYIDASRWAATDKDAYMALAATWVPDEPQDQMSSDYDILKGLDFWPVNGGVDEASVERYVTYAAQVGILTGKIPPTSQWADPTYMNDYLQRNGSQ